MASLTRTFSTPRRRKPTTRPPLWRLKWRSAKLRARKSTPSKWTASSASGWLIFDVVDFLALSFALRHVSLHSGGLVVGLRLLGVEKVLVNEAIKKIHLHHSAVLGHGLQHFVGHIAPRIGKRTCGRMRRNYRSLRGSNCIQIGR